MRNALVVFVCCALTMLGCGADEITIQPVDAIKEWIGAWQYMEDKDGVLVPDGDRKIRFTPEGTWQLSHDDDTGIYVVFEGRFNIGSRTGSWVRDGDILKLVYDDTSIRIFKKTQVFRQYTPPPPPPPPPVFPPSATSVTTSPARGSAIAPNANMTMTLDEAVDGVTVNGLAAVGSGKTWVINMASLNLPAGSATLNIGWRNKDGTAGAGVGVALTIQQERDRVAPHIESSSVHNNAQNVKIAPLNANGISMTFSEDVKRGDISIRIEGGDILNWLAEWRPNSVIIFAVRGAELDIETTYEIRVSTEDGAGNQLDSTISFTTEIKQQ